MGNMTKIVVKVRTLPIDENVSGDTSTTSPISVVSSNGLGMSGSKKMTY
ncbi:hypothetical protein JCM19240_1379 [Vibrio maritimus]|uniref:Uncharacterized protein n=1 Tax=Vibrio maritimus TaxID=990268 RepID=A0A090TDQ2_9VIBR|nr:hypothetical protein JCM19240_1379 [Vibrio maritimus]